MASAAIDNSTVIEKLPAEVEVAELVSGRYPGAERPSSWDQRKAGIDVVRTTDGKLLNLLSDGGQSPPRKGWSLVLMDGDSAQGYTWTLYRMPR